MKIKVGDGYEYNQQLIVSIGKRRFSVVNLIKPLAGFYDTDKLNDIYGETPIEIARTDTKLVNVIGRYASVAEAIKYLEDNASDIWTQKK